MILGKQTKLQCDFFFPSKLHIKNRGTLRRHPEGITLGSLQHRNAWGQSMAHRPTFKVRNSETQSFVEKTKLGPHNMGLEKYHIARQEVLHNNADFSRKACFGVLGKPTFKTPTLCTQITPSHLSATSVSYYTNPSKRSLRRTQNTSPTASATVFQREGRHKANGCLCTDYAQ